MISQLGYIGIGVQDTKAWEEFGPNVLGFEVSGQLDDGTLYLRMDEYHHRFIVEPGGNNDLAFAGWMAPTLDDLNEAEARLKAAGVAVEEGSPEECTYRKVRRFITFKDPSGIRAEVFYGLHVLADDPFHSPRSITGFNTGEMGLGHILVTTSSDEEAEEADRFYRDVLGFRISDYIVRNRPDGAESKLFFYHVNARHHSFAFGAIPTPRRLTHFMIEAKGIDDVGLTYDLCKRLGIPIQQELGVHSNDRMFSFYMRSPSGFSVEYGWGGRHVDDSKWVVQSHHTGNVWGHQRAADPAEAQAQQPAAAR